MSEELRPCPFCGGKAITSAFFDLDDLEYMAIEVNDSESIDGEVTCENERCINGWYLSPKDWNTRPIEDALNARIAELEAAQRWIPVSERLPEPYTRVLACIKSGYMEVDYMYSEPIVDVGSADFNSLDNVTHWMPLPKLPEVQE